MHLESQVVVRRTPEEVWAFLGDPSNIPKWDRGVSGIQQTAAGETGIGLEFDTLGYSKTEADERNAGRMSYRVSEVDPVKGCTVQLTSTKGNARFFKSASWNFRVQPTPEGSRVICSTDFTLRLPYLLLAPILYAKRSAIQFDLQALKRVLETEQLPEGLKL